jgi:hypothetical protein
LPQAQHKATSPTRKTLVFIGKTKSNNMERLSQEKGSYKNTDWIKIQKGYDDYLLIMKNIHIFDDEYKRKFAHFYKLNQGLKNANDKKSFFNLLKDCINNNNDNYVDVLNKLSGKTGRNEMSFASKIVATVNPQKPVIDRIVLGHFKINRPSYGDLQQRISKSINIHNEIETDYLKFLRSNLGKELISIFNTKIKQHRNFKITKIKKLDFILWQTRN